MMQNSLVRALDRLIFNPLARRFNTVEQTLDSEKYFDRINDDFRSSPELFQLSFGILGAIDAKTTALLTHISILIATVSILYSNMPATEVVTRRLLAIEILVYLVATVVCLRCVRFDFPKIDTPETHRHKIYSEITRRRALYSFCLDATVVATIVLVLILAVRFTFH